MTATYKDGNETSAGRKGHCPSSKGTEHDALVQMQQAAASG